MTVSDRSISRLEFPVAGPPSRRPIKLAVAVVVGSLLVIPAAVLQPGPVHEAGPGTSREQLLAAQEWVAAHGVAFHLSDVLIMLGLFSLAWFVREVGVRANAGRTRPSRLIASGSVIATVGLVAAAVANAVISSVRVTLAQPTVDPQQAVDTFLRASNGWYFSPFFGPYLLLVPIGVLMLMVGLIVSQTMPWWAAILGLVFIGAIPFSPPLTAVAVLAGGLLLIWALTRGATRLGVVVPEPEPEQ